MSVFSRTDQNIFAQWWWTVDRWMLLGVAVLLATGLLMVVAASPAVAQKHNLSMYVYAYKQLIFLALGIIVCFCVSLLSVDAIRRLALPGLIASILGLFLTLVFGDPVKGATRWVYIFGTSIQPSEFLKPCFVIISAWLFAKQNTKLDSSAAVWTFFILAISIGLLMAQPDIGQAVLLILVWICLYFLAGASLKILGGLFALLCMGALYAYFSFSHVASRIDRFMDPSSGDTYQVDRAMDAITSGGAIGVGLGNGSVKLILPDAHTDYVFAVAAEEGGFILGAFIILLFMLLVFRCLSHVRNEPTHWVQLAVAGLSCLIGLQAVINLGVNLDIFPTKGMTLPFISYGGSSLLAVSLTFGMLLGLTRRRSSIGRVKSHGKAQVSMVSRSELVL
ncbi:putative lipid II flippase FtsW [Alphaproteobacteria bacterium]|nr:putative lipid II flippase FtsW [Alphaproteobacteria bacterium]